MYTLYMYDCICTNFRARIISLVLHCMVFLGPIRDVLSTGKMDSLDGSKKYSYNNVRKKVY